MSLWGDRLRSALASAACPEAWRLPPRAALALLGELRTIRPVRTDNGYFTHINCPPSGSKAFRRYLAGLRKMTQGGWTPLAAHVSVTGRCMNDCARCSDLSKDTADPAPEKLKAAADLLLRAGTASVALTGGEPLLRQDLPEITALFSEMAPVLFTAGHGLTAALARELKNAGLCAAFVSLDSADPAEHDRGRRREGAFDEACRAISVLRGAGLYAAAQAVAGPALLEGDALDRYLELCRKLKTDDVVILEPMPGRGGSFSAPGPEDRARLTALHERSMSDASLPKITAMSYMESPLKLGCQAGFGFIYLSSGGEVYPCDFAPLSFGNVHSEAWELIEGRLRRYFSRPRRSCLALELQRQSGAVREAAALKDSCAFCGEQLKPEPAPELLEAFLPR